MIARDGLTLWNVVIEFQHGAYTGQATTYTQDLAYVLVLQEVPADKRYSGPVVAKFITQAK